jgi:hypothetical protein
MQFSFVNCSKIFKPYHILKYLYAVSNLKGRWCDINVFNVPAPTEDKDDDIKDSFYEELQQVFDQFPR